jgi:signal recognition particle receptor subunit beta
VARVDTTAGEVVVRLVYDGPAWAGKTTTLRALARSLGREMFSGEEEDGRTLHLDWVEYLGGLYEGRPIRCQIVGVPGQRMFARRRRVLLADADAVVFVADSRRDRLGENAAAFASLRSQLAAAVPPVAVVVQANKRDLPDALPLAALREEIGGGPGVALVATSAERGEGVRECFVLAVRLALDRVRAQSAVGALEVAAHPRERGEDVLAALLAGEVEPSPGPLAATPPREPNGWDRGRRTTHEGRGPWLPDPTVPPGLVWPPVNGRVVAHEASREGVTLSRRRDGDWIAEDRSGRWRMRSPLAALFADVEEGRRALIDWARWHSALGAALSPERAVVLAPAAPAAWRLWQIVRREPSLLDDCRSLVALADAALGDGLLRLIDHAVQAERRLVRPYGLHGARLDDISVSADGDVVYSGFAPFQPVANRPSGTGDAVDGEWVAGDVARALRQELTLTPRRVSAVLANVDAASLALGRPDIARLVRRLLLGA